jgi:hypothetical protein
MRVAVGECGHGCHFIHEIGIFMAKLEKSIGEASGQWASTQTGHTLFPGWSYLWTVPVRSIPAAPCFCLAGRVVAEEQRRDLPLSFQLDVHGISQIG